MEIKLRLAAFLPTNITSFFGALSRFVETAHDKFVKDSPKFFNMKISFHPFLHYHLSSIHKSVTIIKSRKSAY